MKCRTLIRNGLKTLLLITGTSVTAFAQQTVDDDQSGPEEKPAQPRFAISVNAGLIFSYTDVKPSKSAPIFGIGAGYFAAPYLHLNLDLQKGWLRGGESVSGDPRLMGSDNSFIAAAVTARFLPLGLLENKDHNTALSIFSGFYGGIGFGFISNSVKSNNSSSPDYGSLGIYSGASAMLPIEAGIDIPVAKLSGNKRLMLNLNYRVNLCFSDKIDGYVPTVAANEKNDAFNALTAGLVFNF